MKTEEHYIYKEYQEYLKNQSIDYLNYITNRLIGQMIWYDKSAIDKQCKYKRLTILSIILTGIIPVLSLFTGFTYGFFVSVLIALTSSVSTAILSIINLCEYQKLWIEYRSTCEILKSILHRYLTKTGEFTGNNAKDNFELLVSLCERYMTKEFQTWTELSHDYHKKGQ